MKRKKPQKSEHGGTKKATKLSLDVQEEQVVPKEFSIAAEKDFELSVAEQELNDDSGLSTEALGQPSTDLEADQVPGPSAADSVDKTRQRRVLEKRAAHGLEAARRKGVLYMSRVPPHLKPQKLRHILSQYGELGRLYLAPEDAAARKRRKKLKGNTGKNFLEGWIEFLDKKVAKRVASILNGNTMGGKRRSNFQYDIWCLKYLPKFKWEFLTEEIAYQNAVREQKLAAEVSAAKRERDFYLSQVDHAKMVQAKQKRRQRDAAAKRQNAEEGSDQGEADRARRTYNQRKARPDPVDDPEAPALAQDVLALLAGRR